MGPAASFEVPNGRENHGQERISLKSDRMAAHERAAQIFILTVVALKATKTLSIHLINLITRQKEEAELQKRTQTLGSIVRYTLTVAIFIVASMIVLKEFGIEIGPLLAAAGVEGLEIGFGAQGVNHAESVHGLRHTWIWLTACFTYYSRPCLHSLPGFILQ